VLIPVVYSFGGVESKAKNSKVAHEYAEHNEQDELYLFGPPESKTLRLVVGVDCLRIA
jgi:cystathionine beta-lyase/cystathionine gamma-synthase